MSGFSNVFRCVPLLSVVMMFIVSDVLPYMSYDQYTIRISRITVVFSTCLYIFVISGVKVRPIMNSKYKFTCETSKRLCFRNCTSFNYVFT
jgi:hypothetical protein